MVQANNAASIEDSSSDSDNDVAEVMGVVPAASESSKDEPHTLDLYESEQAPTVPMYDACNNPWSLCRLSGKFCERKEIN